MSILSSFEYLTCTSLPVALSVGAVAYIGNELGKGNTTRACMDLNLFLYVILIPKILTFFLL